ncbi:uncharacterized protein LOC127603670 isoform X2 [Hippocampus zosterae]|uniref:uncharacterized protein LOC127603670 isoform X2 n=1 Tax=Hippocampus zosterae TaxID=109293 RepID=UPI00223D2056|nr:uncharacterized protein LOC127603670 isoform X2 [Hippocampus zosterae]
MTLWPLRNLIRMSLLAVLVTAAWTAPAEEREEEAELTEEAEGERSEEDEGSPGAHQSAAAEASGVRAEASSLPDVGGAREASAAAGHADGDASADSDAVDAHSNGERLSDKTATVTCDPPNPFAYAHERCASAHREKPSDAAGGDAGAAGRPTSLEGGASDPDYAGTAEGRFPLGLPGEATWTEATDEESLSDSDVINQAAGGHASDPSPSTAGADRTHRDLLPFWMSASSQQAGKDRSQAHGNGRQTQPADKDGVTAQPTSFGEPPADRLPWAAAGTERTRPSATAPVLRLSTRAQDVSRRHADGTVSPVSTEPAGAASASTLLSGTRMWRTDTVTVATESLFSEPTGTSLVSSGGRASEEPREAGSVGGQYNVWGQGPEGEAIFGSPAVYVAATTALHPISSVAVCFDSCKRRRTGGNLLTWAASLELAFPTAASGAPANRNATSVALRPCSPTGRVICLEIFKKMDSITFRSRWTGH